MRKITRISGIVAVAGIMFAAGLAPASADTVNSTISGGSLTTTTSAPTLSAVTLNGTSTQTSIGNAPTAWSITDARGTGAVWAVSVSATALTSAAGTGTTPTDTTARTIAVTNLTITPGTITPGTGSDAVTGITAPALALSTTSQALVSAAGPNKGTYTLTPAFSLAIPANAYRSNYATTAANLTMNPYTSTITYTIA